MDRLDRLEESTPSRYFTPFALGYIAIRLLSFGAVFAVGFNLEAAIKKTAFKQKTFYLKYDSIIGLFDKL